MLLQPIGVFATYKLYKAGNVDILLRKLFGIFTIISGLIIYFYEI
mgnify:FL=1